VLPLVVNPVSLDTPETGAAFTGLEAQRQPPRVQWSSTERVAKSRFVLSQNANPLTGRAIMNVTNPARSITLPKLSAGIYFWTIQAETPEGFDISPPKPASFRVLPVMAPPISLDTPSEGTVFAGLDAFRRPGILQWSSEEPVGSSRLILSRNSKPPAGEIILDLYDPSTGITLPPLTEGIYYWTISAKTPDGFDISAANPAGFTVLPITLPRVSLDFPAMGTAYTALDSQRQAITVRWSSVETVGSSRFIVSQTPDPPEGEAILDLMNPAVSITLPPLTEGNYYWTIQAKTPEGFDISASGPGSFRVLPAPLLPVPSAMMPRDRYRLQIQRPGPINFSWEPVPGANGYIFTLFKDTDQETPLIRTEALTGTGYSIKDLASLDGEDFIWHVEALHITAGGVIEQHGNTRPYRLSIEIPQPAKPILGDKGTLYGN
jgi:hypothetical protein